LARRLQDLLQVADRSGRIVGEFEMQYAPLERIEPNEYFRPTDDEIDLLAEREHNAWIADRADAGWLWGYASNQPKASRRTTYNKNMTEWNNLHEDVKDYDRNIVRRLGTTLAKADYKIVRKRK
jgi:hypothetical protein